MDRKHILVIDDDRAVRDAFELALDDDYDVRATTSGDEGIAAARQRRPDLVFLDLNMPGKDGVQTLRELAAVDASLDVYIVTAFAPDFMERLARAKNDGLRFQLASKPLAREQIRLIAETTTGGTHAGG